MTLGRVSSRLFVAKKSNFQETERQKKNSFEFHRFANKPPTIRIFSKMANVFVDCTKVKFLSLNLGLFVSSADSPPLTTRTPTSLKELKDFLLTNLRHEGSLAKRQMSLSMKQKSNSYRQTWVCLLLLLILLRPRQQSLKLILLEPHSKNFFCSLRMSKLS